MATTEVEWPGHFCALCLKYHLLSMLHLVKYLALSELLPSQRKLCSLNHQRLMHFLVQFSAIQWVIALRLQQTRSIPTRGSTRYETRLQLF